MGLREDSIYWIKDHAVEICITIVMFLLFVLFIISTSAEGKENQRLLDLCLRSHEKSQYECENDAAMRRQSHRSNTVIIPQAR